MTTPTEKLLREVLGALDSAYSTMDDANKVLRHTEMDHLRPDLVVAVEACESMAHRIRQHLAEPPDAASSFWDELDVSFKK